MSGYDLSGMWCHLKIRKYVRALCQKGTPVYVQVRLTVQHDIMPGMRDPAHQAYPTQDARPVDGKPLKERPLR